MFKHLEHCSFTLKIMHLLKMTFTQFFLNLMISNYRANIVLNIGIIKINTSDIPNLLPIKFTANIQYLLILK